MLYVFKKAHSTFQLFVFLLFSFLIYGFSLPTYSANGLQYTCGMVMDTVPVKTQGNDLIEVIDTLITFNTETYEETVQVTRRMITKEAYAAELKSKTITSDQMDPLDTILIFDPANMTETLMVKNLQTGTTDTIYSDQPINLKKGEKIITDEQYKQGKNKKKKG